MPNGTWLKTDIMADITGLYIGVGPAMNPGSEGAINGVTKYIVNVNELGKSSLSEKPVGWRKNIVFYVFNEGLADEKAWYEQNEPSIETNKAISTTTGTYCAIEKIYNNADIRKRVLAWLIKMISIIYAESGGTTNHAMRLKWAHDCMKDASKYLNPFMAIAALNSDIQTLGNKITDVKINGLASYVDTIATAYDFTN